jgi:SAM-dependent methyltransferase
MRDAVPPDSVAAAHAYETGLVPALMAEWAPRLVAAANIQPGHHVLDVACGTGVLARTAADVVAPAGSVTGLDRDPGMLAVARHRGPDIVWREGSASELPFPDATFDAVVSQFGLMFFPDQVGAIREMWRVLKPGRRLAIAVWGSLADTPAYGTEVALIERVAGSKAGAVMRMPFSLGDRAAFQALFEQAGVDLTSLTTPMGRGRFASIRTMLEVDLVGWLPAVGVHLSAGAVESIIQEGERLLQPYVRADGSVEFASPAHVAVAGKRADAD